MIKNMQLLHLLQDQSKEYALKFLLMDFLFITRLMRLVLCSLLARDVILMIIGLSFLRPAEGACSASLLVRNMMCTMTSHLFSHQLIEVNAVCPARQGPGLSVHRAIDETYVVLPAGQGRDIDDDDRAGSVFPAGQEHGVRCDESSVQPPVDGVCAVCPAGQGSGACFDVSAVQQSAGKVFDGQACGVHQLTGIHVSSAAQASVKDVTVLKVKLASHCCSCRATVLRQNLKIRHLQRQVCCSNTIVAVSNEKNDIQLFSMFI
jgi:hypothetical protein